MSEDTEKRQWALVELMGHLRIAGEVSEYNLGGPMLRVDVPAVGDIPGYTRLFGPAAIYSISFVQECVARDLAAGLRTRPVQAYEFPALVQAEKESWSEAEDDLL